MKSLYLFGGIAIALLGLKYVKRKQSHSIPAFEVLNVDFVAKTVTYKFNGVLYKQSSASPTVTPFGDLTLKVSYAKSFEGKSDTITFIIYDKNDKIIQSFPTIEL